MAWKNAHDALPAWLRSELEKMAAAVEAAAEVNREVITEAAGNCSATNRTHMRPALRVISSRCFDTALPRRVPHRGAVSKHLVLVVDNAHQTVSGARVSSR